MCARVSGLAAGTDARRPAVRPRSYGHGGGGTQHRQRLRPALAAVGLPAEPTRDYRIGRCPRTSRSGAFGFTIMPTSALCRPPGEVRYVTSGVLSLVGIIRRRRAVHGPQTKADLWLVEWALITWLDSQ